MSNISKMAGRLLRPQGAFTFKASPQSIARLHQQGPARSAVVHDQAIPHSQAHVPASETPFIPTSKSQAPTSQLSESGAANLDTLVSHIPLVQSLRDAHSTYKESRPHLAIPPAIRQHHFVGGSLTGSGKLAFQPYMWLSTGKTGSKTRSNRASTVVSVFHIGQDLCGHPGFVHGGLLSVMFDEVFARCVSAAFPSGLGMTANLNVDFRKPALPDRVYVLRTETTKVEGRKAWVEGRMTYLPLALPQSSDANSVMSDLSLLREDHEGAVMVAEAKALFIEPKFADSMVSVYRN
ncbi:unnamed protein product [Penicillium salamii]|uniref:Thioesterase domain-containing protein n=1 Tax=Penicillium salamii TaxID=1612424 RepID=A0A9W4JPW3_9EURO|nr:unnamed protein product [Penicillium salamii]CAG8257939.1 unnamed protein product [Penicillium salamii]CAG8375270.1 unnamed protein product [Penicillium salamii]CAG8399367.1 unnamed protein product [Penicillium salamii]CAG8405468.1 unnamed protein product [Penicillium salamii]